MGGARVPIELERGTLGQVGDGVAHEDRHPGEACARVTRELTNTLPADAPAAAAATTAGDDDAVAAAGEGAAPAALPTDDMRATRARFEVEGDRLV